MKQSKLALLIIPFICVSCTAPKAAITSSQSQLETRQIQTREYEQVSIKQAMRACIATLQDLSFILDKVDADLGTISASTYKNGVHLKMTVVVREKTPSSVSVRANATYGNETVVNPLPYQDFFSLLDKSLFLVKNRVD